MLRAHWRALQAMQRSLIGHQDAHIYAKCQMLVEVNEHFFDTLTRASQHTVQQYTTMCSSLKER